MHLSKVITNYENINNYSVEQSYTYLGDNYWDWSVWIESSDPKKLDNISSVTYHLHNTFPNPVRTIKDIKSKFRLETSGWGVFTIYIVLNLKDQSVIELTHDLKLQYPPVAPQKPPSVKYPVAPPKPPSSKSTLKKNKKR